MGGHIYHSVNELPAVFDEKTLQEFMGMSRSATYQLIRRSDFPSFRVGRRILIDREKFRIWLDSQSNRTAS